MRRAMSIASWSLKAAGAERSELSTSIATSALLRAGRLLEPEKITSSMEEARMDLSEDSPITQRSASTRFDLPQPFGPTTPVSPGSIRKSVGSTNDLKPIRRSRVSFMLQASLIPNATVRNDMSIEISSPFRGLARSGFHRKCRIGRHNESARLLEQLPRGAGARFSRPFDRAKRRNLGGDGRRRAEKPLSALELRVDRLGHLLDGQSPRILVAVDEKGRRRLHLEFVDGAAGARFGCRRAASDSPGRRRNSAR